MEFKENTDFDLIGLGEVMLRLSPPNKEKISQSETFEKNAGGSELNVVSGAAMLGIRSAIVTKLPENKMGHFIRNKIRYGNVSDDYIIYDHSPQKRLGVYYYESGAYPRKSSVIYDRANSSFCSLSLDELPEDIYAKTKIFHISSITLALDPSLKETAIKMIHKFHEAGAYISFDVNYRASLWSEEEAKKTVEAIFPYVDFLFVSEETSRRMLQRTGTLEEIMKGYADTYGCTLIATTRREADRIGSGDAYLAGVLYGLIKFGTPERAIEIGNALSAVKNTVAGDMSASSIEEIESVIKSHKATGHQDEMVR